ncbi:hypothetical protein [Novosphingobium sp. 9]|uniref:hypothetical protein n=1 Tax=Novosphingobium sp. 9 TaxID=2025349 RepID=UPI0021B587D4|nr:hypothetical protein [Novosphingobium sp. 9]
MDHNPETGEVIEERGADGGARYPAASTLSDLMLMLKDGQFNADSSAPLQEFATKLEAAGIDNSKKVKGKITLSIDVEFDPDREFSVLTPSLAFKLPVEKHGATVAWFTSDGRLSPNKPRQGNLFGTIREVTTTEARTVRG